MTELETLEMLLEKTKEAEKLVYDSAESKRFNVLITGIRRIAYLELDKLKDKDSTPFRNCMGVALMECKFDAGEEPIAVDWASSVVSH